MIKVTSEDMEQDPLFYKMELPYIKFVQQQSWRTYRAGRHGNPSIVRVYDYAPIVKKEKPAPELCIIIPVYGRKDHLKFSVECLKKQIHENSDVCDVVLAVAEMSANPEHKELCAAAGVEYLFIPCSTFNKSLAMNGSVACFPAENYLFYDVDLVVEKNWLARCLGTISSLNKSGNYDFICQPIEGRKIKYVDEKNTASLFQGSLSTDDLLSLDHEISPEWFKGNYPPGGAILVSANLIYTTQGYDPALYWGYSPEDLFFLKRCLTMSPTNLITWNEIPGSMTSTYHLHHENNEHSNIFYEHMVFAADLVQFNQGLSDWYTTDKLRWNNIPSATMAVLRDAEKRFTPGFHQEMQDLYHTDGCADKNIFVQKATELLDKKYPDLQKYNYSLYTAHMRYVNFISERADNFYKFFRNS